MKHIHQWRIYTPPVEPQMRLEPCDPWTYRVCDCGAKMRCVSFKLEPYPRDFRAFADEEWQDV